MKVEAQSRKRVQKILSAAFHRKQAAKPGYSQRALARDLGVSAAFVTKILSGKKNPPRSRLKTLSHLLELDLHDRSSLFQEVYLKQSGAESLPFFSRRKILKKRKTADVVNRSLITKWWNLALLEGLALQAPFNEPNLLRERLGLRQAEFESAMRCLIEQGVVELREGKYQKRDSHLYLPTGRSKKEVRDFHEQMIQLARTELTGKTADADFHRRLITGFTFSLNPALIEPLKEKILTFLDELATEATEGDCTEVYQCNLQFFPLTKQIN